MKLMIVDDHDIFRQSLAMLLGQQPEFSIEAHFSSVAALLASDVESAVDVVLLDYHLPDEDPISTLGAIQKRWRGTKVVFLTGARAPAVLQRIVQSGVAGVLHKNDSAESIVELLSKLSENVCCLSPFVEAELASIDFDLTTKEFDVLALITRGYTPTQIADTLHVSKRTVEKHKENIMRKLDVHNLAQLIELGNRLVLPE